MNTRILTLTVFTAAWIAQAGAATPSDLIRSVREHQQPAHQSSAAKHVTPKKQRNAAPPRHRARRDAAEKKLAAQTPVRRRFRTLAEYRRLERRAERRTERRANRHTPKKQAVRHARNVAPSHGRHLSRQNRYVGNGWYVDEHGQYDEQYTDSGLNPAAVRRHHRPQRPYRYYRRQWYLTYLWEHASFVDQYGYVYGAFDERGFYFEGTYYRYDRAYTYMDRLHGKGLFEHRFYRPRHHRVRRHRVRRHHRPHRTPYSGLRGEVYVEWTRSGR